MSTIHKLIYPRRPNPPATACGIELAAVYPPDQARPVGSEELIGASTDNRDVFGCPQCERAADRRG
jgi:hypothetical protein